MKHTIINESFLVEDDLNPYFKKDAKRQYKDYLDKTADKRKMRDEVVKDIRELGVETGKSKEFINDKVDKAKEKFAVPDFELDKNKALERQPFPYYVTHYYKSAVYEPAEGGYYVEVQYPDYSKGYDTYDEAKAEIDEFIADDATNPWHEVGKDEYEWQGKYVGDGEYVRIETDKTYLKAVEEYNGYESFGKKFKSKKRPSKLKEAFFDDGYDSSRDYGYGEDRSVIFDCKQFYRDIYDRIIEGSNADTPNNIKQIFSDLGGKAYVRNLRQDYFEIDGWLPTNGINVGGSNPNKWTFWKSFRLSDLYHDADFLAEDLTKWYYTCQLKGTKVRHTQDLSYLINNYGKIDWKGTPALAKAMKEEYSAYNDKVKVPDGYEIVTSTATRDYTYEIARNIYTDENGNRRGRWIARNVDTDSDWFPITWEQAVGYEPIEESSIGKLRRQMGKLLLPKNESVLSDRIRKNQLDYDDEIDAYYSKDGDTEIQFQDRLSNTHEYSGVKDNRGRIVGMGRKLNRQPKTTSKTWGRVWKNGDLKKSFEGPKYKVRGEMINYLDNNLTESVEDEFEVSNNRLIYPDRDNLYNDLHGTIQYYAFAGPMRKLGVKNGIEYGIVGSNRNRNSRYNYTSGHIGYKIDDGVVYITKFSPASIAEASRWVREDIKNSDAWSKLGKIKNNGGLTESVEDDLDKRTVKQLKKGEYFTLKPIAEPKESQVWVKGDYDKSTKTYDCHRFSDTNDFKSIKADKEVYTGFTF